MFCARQFVSPLMLMGNLIKLTVALFVYDYFYFHSINHKVWDVFSDLKALYVMKHQISKHHKTFESYLCWVYELNTLGLCYSWKRFNRNLKFMERLIQYNPISKTISELGTCADYRNKWSCRKSSAYNFFLVFCLANTYIHAIMSKLMNMNQIGRVLMRSHQPRIVWDENRHKNWKLLRALCLVR